MGEEELVYLYTIMGLFVAHKKHDYEERKNILRIVLSNLVEKIKQLKSHEKDKLLFALKLINVFTKNFQQDISKPIKDCFSETLQM